MEESGLWRGEGDPIPLSHNSWIKRWLQSFRDHSLRKQGAAGTDPAGQIEQGQSEQEASAPRLRKCLLLAAIILLVLTLMVLLLFWNYQYIVVWKLLHDQKYTSFPMFGGMEEEEENLESGRV